MIRVKIKKTIFIRKGPARNFAAIGTAFPGGKEIKMDGIEEGENWKGINKWYFRINNKNEKQFYWSGGIEPIEDNKAASFRELSLRDAATSPLITHLGIDKIWAQDELGELAKVAIIDSGIALSCSDLADAADQSASNGTMRMKNFVKDSNTIDDDFGHGSHCAGLIASRNKLHVVGMAPACKLYVAKIRDANTSVTVPNMISGIRWAAGLEPDSPQDIDIISMSNGSLLNLPDMKPTIDAALQRKKILVFAIGNRSPGGVPAGGDFPAVFPGVISVGALDLGNNFLDSFQFENLTICCPGQNISSYWVNGQVRPASGSSQATAICAGIIALLVSRMKKKNETDIPKKIMSMMLASDTLTTANNFQYRVMNPVQLFQTIN